MSLLGPNIRQILPDSQFEPAWHHAGSNKYTYIFQLLVSMHVRAPQNTPARQFAAAPGLAIPSIQAAPAPSPAAAKIAKKPAFLRPCKGLRHRLRALLDEFKAPHTSAPHKFLFGRFRGVRHAFKTSAPILLGCHEWCVFNTLSHNVPYGPALSHV